MQKPYDEDGNEIDSLYQIERGIDGFDLIIESQGGSTGGRPPRNTGYAKAVAHHLQRMKAMNSVLEDVQIASAPVMKYPEDKRRIVPEGFSLPLVLHEVDDLELLRLAIGRASAAFENPNGYGGNRTKKLRLRMAWQHANDLTASQIADLLAGSMRLEKTTADPAELQLRVARAQIRLLSSKQVDQTHPPPGQRIVPTAPSPASRYVRDPEVIAWVLLQAAGTCENCGKPAPFIRANGEAFLEVHHVRPLGDGGPDTVDNAAACCPNCHRRLHYDPDRESLRLALIEAVARLKDHPSNA
ncbi:HNH endonuclease [Ruegeria sp.]|uniref:HNH endonuclease n=1 Tax=Ruegeria sp. TaxID=1879320 RepID=UPI003C7C31F6